MDENAALVTNILKDIQSVRDDFKSNALSLQSDIRNEFAASRADIERTASTLAKFSGEIETFKRDISNIKQEIDTINMSIQHVAEEVVNEPIFCI